MVEVLRSSSSICVASHAFPARECSSRPKIENVVGGLRGKSNVALTKRRTGWKIFGAQGLTAVSTSHLCCPRCMVEFPLGISAGILIRRRRAAAVMVAGFQSGLVCEEDETDSSLKQVGNEPEFINYEQRGLPVGERPALDGPESSSPLVLRDEDLKVHYIEEPDVGILSRSILTLSRSNKVRGALELYLSVELSGLQPSTHASNSLISCLVRNGYLENALRLFEEMKKKGVTSSHSYSLILKAVARARGCDSALKLFLALEGDGIAEKRFDPIVYNTLISAFGREKDWVQMERMWRKLKQHGFAGTRVTYSVLVCAFVRCGQSELALDAFHEMLQNHLKPGEDTLRAAMGACAKEGKWTMALDVFQHIVGSGLKPDATTFNAFINCLGKAGEVELAFKAYELMVSSCGKVDAYTWKALLSALYRRARYFDVLHLFESLRMEKASEVNHHLYNVALMSCQKLRFWDRAVQILWEMEERGILISVVSYNHVIGACEAARKPRAALEVYKHMIHNNFVPDIFTYLSLIRACAWESLWKEAEGILHSVTPDASLYNALIQGMCLQQQTVLANRLYKEMQNHGLKPDGKTRALMLQHLSKD